MSTMKYVRNKTWTPNEIEVLIWCRCRPEPHPRRTAGAVIDATQKLLRLGLIEPGGDGYCTATAKGVEVLEAMKRVPFPSDKPATPNRVDVVPDPYVLLQEVTETLALVTFFNRHHHPDVEMVNRLNDLLDRARAAVAVHKGTPLPAKEGETV